MQDMNDWPISYFDEATGAWSGFEAALVGAMRRAGADINITTLPSLEDRITALESGAVDAVIAGTRVAQQCWRALLRAAGPGRPVCFKPT